MTPPFSEHYARDFGDVTLGIALLLAIAFVRPRAHYVIPAALAYAIFAVPHFFFHLTHMEATTHGQAIALTGVNAAVALLAIAIIAVTITRDRRTGRRPTPPPGPAATS